MWKKDNFFCKCCNSKQSEKKIILVIAGFKNLSSQVIYKTCKFNKNYYTANFEKFTATNVTATI